jgi:hypothetical protein
MKSGADLTPMEPEHAFISREVGLRIHLRHECQELLVHPRTPRPIICK